MTITLKRILRIGVVNLLVVIGLLAVVEGLIGYAVAVSNAFLPGWAERRHARFDAELGWRHIPNTHIPDMYGPGAALTINSQGFRATRDFTTAVHAGKQRIVCVGDSFTLGYGVGDADTWCERLSAHDQRLETINMGQGGYGLDQAYLWYKRDGLRFDHHATVVAFITEDFNRMMSTDSGLYAKPVLALHRGSLVVQGVPVAFKATDRFPRLRSAVGHLHTFQLARSAILRFRPSESRREDTVVVDYQTVRDVVSKVLEDLKAVSDQRSRSLLLVYLPTPPELIDGTAREWREFMASESQRLEIPLVDTFGSFEALSRAELQRMFISEGELRYHAAEGHLSVDGNARVAELVYAHLRTLLH